MIQQITSFAQYQEVYNQSITDPEGFWAEVAQNFQWRKPWKKTLEWDFATANTDRKSTRLNSSHSTLSRMPSSA